MLAILSEGGNLDHLGEAAQLLGGNNKITTKEGNPKMSKGKLAILSEGGNLEHLGETAQIFAGNNKLSVVTSSAPSQVSTKEGNPKHFRTMTGIPVIVDEASHKTFVSTKTGVEDKSQGGLLKADSTDKLDCQNSSTNTSFVQNTMLEIVSKECKQDLSEFSDVSHTFSRINDIDKSAKDIKSEGEVFLDNIVDMKTEVDSTKPNQKEGLKDPSWPSPGSLTPGLLFPDYNSMTTSLDEWSQANFSPMTKASSGLGGFGQGKPFHNFRCPHKKAHKRSSLGLRRQKANVIEYVDCPFLIDTKVNADGSCVVTRAMTEHSGHPISVEQFQIYRR